MKGSDFTSQMREIATDAALSETVKGDLIAALREERLDENARRAGEQDRKQAQGQFEAQYKRDRWRMPIWVALTGAITIAINFGFNYLRTNQEAKIAKGQLELTAGNERTIATNDAIARRELQSDKFKAERDALSLAFQFDIIKSEIKTRETALELAQSLRFLLRAGVLSEPLNIEQISKIISEVEGGDITAVPPVGPTSSDRYEHAFEPCTDVNDVAVLTARNVLSVAPIRRQPIPQAIAAMTAFRNAMADNGFCSPQHMALLTAVMLYETNFLTVFEQPPQIAKAMFARFPGRPHKTEADAVKFRARGFDGTTGRARYERLAQLLNEPRLSDTPELLATDFDLAAHVFMANLKQTNLMSNCPPDSCDAQATLRRMLGSGTGRAGSIYKPLLEEFEQ